MVLVKIKTCQQQMCKTQQRIMRKSHSLSPKSKKSLMFEERQTSILTMTVCVWIYKRIKPKVTPLCGVCNTTSMTSSGIVLCCKVGWNTKHKTTHDTWLLHLIPTHPIFTSGWSWTSNVRMSSRHKVKLLCRRWHKPRPPVGENDRGVIDDNTMQPCKAWFCKR